MATAKKKAKPMAHKAAKKAPAKKAAARKAPAKHSAKSGGHDYTTYSGKFTVRLPRSLHQALVDRAEKEGVSLNLFVTNALSRTVAASGKKK
jgi:predicted HicB family RNase H-like nuclease